MDFIVGNEMAIEIKASKKISQRDHKGLIALSEEKKWNQMIIVSQDPVQARFKNGIQHLHWEAFLTKLWKRLASLISLRQKKKTFHKRELANPNS